MAIPNFVFLFIARQGDLAGVDNNDRIARVDMGRVGRQMLTAQTQGDTACQPPQDQPVGINDDPLAVLFSAFQGRSRGFARPISMTAGRRMPRPLLGRLSLRLGSLFADGAGFGFDPLRFRNNGGRSLRFRLGFNLRCDFRSRFCNRLFCYRFFGRGFFGCYLFCSGLFVAVFLADFFAVFLAVFLSAEAPFSAPPLADFVAGFADFFATFFTAFLSDFLAVFFLATAILPYRRPVRATSVS